MRYCLRVSTSPGEAVSRRPAAMTGAEPFRRLAAVWRERVDVPARRAAIAVVVASVFALAHLARVGSPAARSITAAALVAIVGGLLIRAILARRGWTDARKTVQRTVVATNPEVGE